MGEDRSHSSRFYMEGEKMIPGATAFRLHVLCSEYFWPAAQRFGQSPESEIEERMVVDVKCTFLWFRGDDDGSKQWKQEMVLLNKSWMLFSSRKLEKRPRTSLFYSSLLFTTKLVFHLLRTNSWFVVQKQSSPRQKFLLSRRFWKSERKIVQLISSDASCPKRLSILVTSPWLNNPQNGTRNGLTHQPICIFHNEKLNRDEDDENTQPLE